MTVRELIEELKKIDENKIVYGENGFGYLGQFSQIIEDDSDNSVIIEFAGN